MKTDKKLFGAVVILIILVCILIVISLNKKEETPYRSNRDIQIEIEGLKKAISDMPTPKDGKTPVLGVDYFNGNNGSDGKDGKDGVNGLSTYEIAVKHGFTGTEDEWIASQQSKTNIQIEVNLECKDGVIFKKTTLDEFYVPTNIKCRIAK